MQREQMTFSHNIRYTEVRATSKKILALCCNFWCRTTQNFQKKLSLFVYASGSSRSLLMYNFAEILAIFQFWI